MAAKAGLFGTICVLIITGLLLKISPDVLSVFLVYSTLFYPLYLCFGFVTGWNTFRNLAYVRQSSVDGKSRFNKDDWTLLKNVHYDYLLEFFGLPDVLSLSDDK